jgi:hypothetical protein
MQKLNTEKVSGMKLETMQGSNTDLMGVNVLWNVAKKYHTDTMTHLKVKWQQIR